MDFLKKTLLKLSYIIRHWTFSHSWLSAQHVQSNVWCSHCIKRNGIFAHWSRNYVSLSHNQALMRSKPLQSDVNLRSFSYIFDQIIKKFRFWAIQNHLYKISIELIFGITYWINIFRQNVIKIDVGLAVYTLSLLFFFIVIRHYPAVHLMPIFTQTIRMQMAMQSLLISVIHEDIFGLKKSRIFGWKLTSHIISCGFWLPLVKCFNSKRKFSQWIVKLIYKWKCFGFFFRSL